MAKSIRDHKDDGGFWVPNQLIDLHAVHVGARGIYLYCLLCRALTQTQYPSVNDLIRKTRFTKGLVELLLKRLHEFGLLNTSDLNAICNKEKIKG